LVHGETRAGVARAVLWLAGGVVALTLLVPWIGAATLWLQLDSLGLPAGDAVADALPATVWIDEGARALVVPLLAAIAVAIVVLAFAWIRRRSSFGRIARTALVAVVIGAPALTLAREWADPQMHPAAIVLSEEDELVAGFLIAETSERAYMVALPSGHPRDAFDGSPIERVVAVPDEKVAALVSHDRASIASDPEQRAAAMARAVTERAPVPELAEGELASALAPLVHFDRRERWLPMSAREFVDGSTLKFANDDFCSDTTLAVGKDRPRLLRKVGAEIRYGRLGEIQTAYRGRQTTKDCRPESWRPEILSTDHSRPQDARRPAGLGIKEGFYLDLASSKRSGAKPASTRSRAVLRDVPVYVERTPVTTQGRPGILLTYWMLHGMSASDGGMASHEGGWQRIAVLVRRQGVGGGYRPIAVRYHYLGELYRELPWDDVQRVTDRGLEAPDATHPVVFSARRTHGAYWRPGHFAFDLRAEDSSPWPVVDRAEACSACPRWRTWDRVHEVQDQGWYGFGGGWGEAPEGGDSTTTGPLGPSRYKVLNGGAVTTDGRRRVGPLERRVTADVEVLSASGR
jgi:hypothetical protein